MVVYTYYIFFLISQISI